LGNYAQVAADMIQKWHGSKVNVRVDMDDVMTNNFEIFVKGKNQTYLVHSRMKKNHKLFKEESPEHLALVKLAIKDIMSGKVPTLPESRKKAEGKGPKTAEERDAEAKTRAEEQARKTEEAEKKRQTQKLQTQQLQASRESIAADKKIAAKPAAKQDTAKVDEKKKARKAPSTEAQNHVTESNVESIMEMKRPKSEKRREASPRIPSQGSQSQKSTRSSSSMKKIDSESPTLVAPSISTSAGSTNSSPGSIQEKSDNEHRTEDKTLDIVDEGPDEPAQQSVVQKQQEHAIASTSKSTVQSGSHKENPHVHQIGSPELANVEVASAPASVQEREACLEPKVILQHTKPRDVGTKTSPPSFTQKDVLSSFFAFACCRSPSIVDDRTRRGFEDYRAEPEVDACFVGA